MKHSTTISCGLVKYLVRPYNRWLLQARTQESKHIRLMMIWPTWSTTSFRGREDTQISRCCSSFVVNFLLYRPMSIIRARIMTPLFWNRNKLSKHVNKRVHSSTLRARSSCQPFEPSLMYVVRLFGFHAYFGVLKSSNMMMCQCHNIPRVGCMP